MAPGARPLSRRAAPDADADRVWQLGAGALALALLSAFLGGAFLCLLAAADEGERPAALLADPYLRGVLVFTLEQALLSVAVSLAAALPVAVALHRASFPGKTTVLRLCLLPQALPTLVGGLAVLAVWGRSGWVSGALQGIGLPPLDVYGLSGILIAHVFFNMPLAVRLFVAALDRVPAESWRLAGQLGMPPAAVFRLVEWPALRTAIPGAAGLIFMVCVTSFALVLVLGGGPRASTLIVEIYQALRTDFEPGRAVTLAFAQVFLTALVLLALRLAGGEAGGGFTLGAQARRFDGQSRGARLAGRLVLAAGLAFLAAPFVALVARGLVADLPRLLADPAVHHAAATSTAVALLAASLATLLALCLLYGAEAARSKRLAALFETSGSLALVVPPVVVGAGWFLALRGGDVFAAGPVLVVLSNAAMALPFVLRILGPALREARQRQRRLVASLGLRGVSRLRHVELPAVASPLGLAFAFALTLSLGDLGVAALFGNEDFVTLPYLLYQRLGSYRFADADGLALLLGVLATGLILLAERIFQTRRR